MKKTKSSLILKSMVSKCQRCNGNGYESKSLGHCKLCLGTGKLEEKNYIIVDNHNKIAIDSDCGA